MVSINDLLQLCLQLPGVEAVCRLQRVLRVPAGKEHRCLRLTATAARKRTSAKSK